MELLVEVYELATQVYSQLSFQERSNSVVVTTPHNDDGTRYAFRLTKSAWAKLLEAGRVFFTEEE